jgi:hypothetical protein
MPSVAAPALSDDALVELLSLIKGADSVELKLTIPESSQRSTIQALGMDPLGAQVRLVYFFDTPDLTLESHGVVVRARRSAVAGGRPLVGNERRDRCAGHRRRPLSFRFSDQTSCDFPAASIGNHGPPASAQVPARPR